jgi:hypothetical protein
MKSHSILFFLSFFLLLETSTFSQDDRVKEFKINPNPTSGIVNIEINYSTPSGLYLDTDIEVYTLNGELITKRPISVNSPYPGLYTISDTFYLTGYSSGIYLVKINFLGTLLVSRLILIK